MRVAIAGLSGLIGRHLGPHLKEKGHEVIEIPHVGDHLILDERHLDVEAVINLSGVNMMHRATEEFKKQALASRAGTSLEINHFYDQVAKKPKVFIAASAIGYYGDHPGETLIESSPKGLGFLADLVEKWEKATLDSPIHRIVIFRLGMVLSADGGALTKIASSVKKYMGCIWGNPEAYLSWVHIDDVVKAFSSALERSCYSGIYNLVSEEAVTQKRFMNTLAKVLGKRVFLHLPKFILKLFLAESASLITSEIRAFPKKLKQNDFEFLYPDLESALYSLKTRGL